MKNLILFLSFFLSAAQAAPVHCTQKIDEDGNPYRLCTNDVKQWKSDVKCPFSICGHAEPYRAADWE